MPLWIDKKYINMISPKLPLFKWKKPTLANFRCTICGDSKQNKLKARGYFYCKGPEMFFRCHNCGAGLSLGNFIKTVDSEIYAQYVFESYEEKRSKNRQIKKEEVPSEKLSKQGKTHSEPIGAQKVKDLHSKHFALEYLKGRQIPQFWQDQLLYTDDLSKFEPEIESFKPAKPYIIIPIYNKDGILVGYNCRSLLIDGKNDAYRYIKLKLKENEPLFFGSGRVDTNKQVYVFEGEFDSMFVENAIAVGGVAMMRGVENYFKAPKERFVCVVDKDTRNREVIKNINDLIEDGYKVVLFPGNIEGKDLNEIVLKHKLSIKQIRKLLEKNTFEGIRAILELAYWRKT